MPGSVGCLCLVDADLPALFTSFHPMQSSQLHLARVTYVRNFARALMSGREHVRKICLQRM